MQYPVSGNSAPVFLPIHNWVKAVKQLPAYRFTPVIMLTTEAGEDKKREGQAAGAKAWVVKPFQPQQMLGAVAKLVLP